MKRRFAKPLFALTLSAALGLTLLPTAVHAEDKPWGWWMEYGEGWHTDEDGYRFYVDGYGNIHWDLNSGDTTPPETDTPPADTPPADTPPTKDPSSGSSSHPPQESMLRIENGELLGVDVPGYGFRDTLVIPDSVTRIRRGALSWQQRMTGVVIPAGVTEIGEEAFYKCDLLTGVTIPEGVTRIERGTFAGCYSMTELKIPDGVTSIGADAFSSCSGLTSLTLPRELREIGEGAFRYCEGLTEVTIPDKVETIGDLAFTDCDNLTKVTIPDNVSSIGEFAFSGLEDTLTIYGDTGSAAETFAKEQGFAFVSTGISKRNPPKPVEDAPNLTAASSWAREGLTTAYNAGLIPEGLREGYTQTATRAEFCALAVALYEKATGLELFQGRPIFSDTTDPDVLKMVYIGVVTGVGDDRFDPDGKLTREQAATMLSRLASAAGIRLAVQDTSATENESVTVTVQAAQTEVSASETVGSRPAAASPTFADNGDISSWAFEAVGLVQGSGIMGGVGDNRFDPQGEYTREQSILTMLRLYQLAK